MDWKKVGIHTCVCFTAITAALLTAWMMINTESVDGGFSVMRILCFLPFSALFSFGNINFKYSESKLSLRVLFHFLFTVGGAFVFLYLPSRVEGDTLEAAVAMAILMVALYWALMGTFLLLRNRIQRVDRDTKQYKRLYSSKTGTGGRPTAQKTKNADSKNGKKNKDDYQSVYKKK